MCQEIYSKHHKILTELRSVIICFLSIFVLSHGYKILAAEATLQMPLPEKVLVLNSLLAFGCLIYFSSHSTPFPFWPKNLLLLLIPLFIILLTLMLGYISSPKSAEFGDFIPNLYTHWRMIFIVPIAEEVLFRLGLWRLLGASSLTSKVYLTSMSFALMHYSGGGWPIGPFLLGVLSQLFLIAGGGILTSILLHMACNATVVIFLSMDERWFDWLKLFYLR